MVNESSSPAAGPQEEDQPSPAAGPQEEDQPSPAAGPQEEDRSHKTAVTSPEDSVNITEQSIGRRILKHWRPFAFLIILSIAVAFGVTYKVLGDPGRVNQQFLNQAPLTMDVFVSDPKISVQVIASTLCMPSSSSNLNGPISCTAPDVAETWLSLALTVRAPKSLSDGHIIVISSAASLAGHGKAGLSINGSAPHSQWYYQEYSLDEFRAPGLTSNAPAGIYIISPVLKTNKKSIFGHLPAIGALEFPIDEFPDLPPLLVENQSHTKKIGDFIYNPQLRQTMSVVPIKYQLRMPVSERFQTLHNGDSTLFWRPNSFSITETLLNATSILNNEQLDYVTPAGEVRGQDYAWESNSSLEPFFKSTNPDAADTLSNDDFFSGIAWGVAGAAAIALVQELPKDRRRRNLRQDSI